MDRPRHLETRGRRDIPRWRAVSSPRAILCRPFPTPIVCTTRSTPVLRKKLFRMFFNDVRTSRPHSLSAAGIDPRPVAGRLAHDASVLVRIDSRVIPARDQAAAAGLLGELLSGEARLDRVRSLYREGPPRDLVSFSLARNSSRSRPGHTYCPWQADRPQGSGVE